MNKCVKIAKAIWKSSEAIDSFQICIVATEPIQELSLDDLRKQYFGVGFAKPMAEIPFHDLIVVLKLIETFHFASKNHSAANSAMAQTLSALETDFPPEEVRNLLSQVPVQTPFDQQDHLQVRI